MLLSVKLVRIFIYSNFSPIWKFTCWRLQLCHITCIRVIHVEPGAKYMWNICENMPPDMFQEWFNFGFLPHTRFQMFQLGFIFPYNHQNHPRILGWLKKTAKPTKIDRLGCQRVRQVPLLQLGEAALQRPVSDHPILPIPPRCLQPKETGHLFQNNETFLKQWKVAPRRTPCKKMTTPPSPLWSPSNDLLAPVIRIAVTPNSFYPFITLSFALFLQTSQCSSCMTRCPSAHLTAIWTTNCADNAADNSQWRDSLSKCWHPPHPPDLHQSNGLLPSHHWQPLKTIVQGGRGCLAFRQRNRNPQPSQRACFCTF